MTFCPDDERFARWIEGSLPSAEWSELAAHLAACDDCRRGLALSWVSLLEPPAAITPAQELAARAAVASAAGCSDEQRLARWIEGTLDDVERNDLVGHLASCDDCRRAAALGWLSLLQSAPAITDAQKRAAHDVVTGVAGCPDEQRLARWVDGSLEVGERAALAEHLGACDRCRRSTALAWMNIQEPARDEGSGIRRVASDVVIARTACPGEEPLARFLEGALESPERAEVVDHLAQCDDCRRAAALTRVMKEEPVHALTRAQEQTARRVIAKRQRVFRWQWPAAAAAAVIVAGIVLLVSRPKDQPDNVVKQPVGPRTTDHLDFPAPLPELRPEKPPVAPPKTEDPPAPRSLSNPGKPEPPPVEPMPEPEEPVPAPEPPKPEPPKPEPRETRVALADLFKPVDVIDAAGTFSLDGTKAGLSRTQEFGYGKLLSSESGATFNVAGRALVSVDRKSELALATSKSSGAYVAYMHRGRAFIDTVKDEQSWELWHGERRIEAASVRGRVLVDVTGGALSMCVLSGELKLGDGALKAGQSVTVSADGRLERAKAADLSAALRRANELRPQSMALWRADFDKPRAAVLGPGPDAQVPASLWFGLELDAPVFGALLQVRYRTTATKVYIVVDGLVKEIAVRPGGWTTEEWALAGAEKEGDKFVPESNAIRSIHLGVRSGGTLEVESIQVRCRLK